MSDSMHLVAAYLNQSVPTMVFLRAVSIKLVVFSYSQKQPRIPHSFSCFQVVVGYSQAS